MESERQREKLEGEVRMYEDKVNRMRHQMDDMVSTLVVVGLSQVFEELMLMLLANDRERAATREAARGTRCHGT